MEQNVEVQVIKMLDDEFGTKDTPTHLSRIKDCLNKCDLVSVFEIDNKCGGKDIDVAMLQALLKGG